MTNPCEMPAEPALIYDGAEDAEADYTLSGELVWITVGNTTVYIKREPKCVRVELSQLGNENEPFATITTPQPEY